nr:hypothetical protein [Clostridia bacterium]
DVDLNGDGKLTVLDILMTMKMCLNREYNSVADFNEDGKITLIDVLRMLKLCTNA